MVLVYKFDSELRITPETTKQKDVVGLIFAQIYICWSSGPRMNIMVGEGVGKPGEGVGKVL